MESLGRLATAAGVPALIVATYNARSKAASDQILHQQSRELEIIRSESRQLESKFQVEHGWFFQQRAQAVVETFSLVIDVDMKIVALVQTVAHQTSDADTRTRLFRQAHEASLDLFARSRKSAIFFPLDVNAQFTALDQLLLKKSISASVYRDPKTAQDYDALAEASNWSDVTAAVAELKTRLQRLLGDVIR